MKEIGLVLLSLLFYVACDAPRNRLPFESATELQSSQTQQSDAETHSQNDNGSTNAPDSTSPNAADDLGFEHCTYSLSNGALEIGNVSICLHKPTKTKFRVMFDLADPAPNTYLVPMYRDPSTLQTLYLSITIPFTSQTLEIQQDQFFINRPGLPEVYPITHVMVIKDLSGAYNHFFDCMNAVDPFLRQQICSSFETVHVNRHALVPVEF